MELQEVHDPTTDGLGKALHPPMPPANSRALAVGSLRNNCTGRCGIHLEIDQRHVGPRNFGSRKVPGVNSGTGGN